MIDALLENDALTVPCTLTYGGTKYTECPNCIFDAVTSKSTNRYKSGGPVPFYQGPCPYCAGVGRIQLAPATETLYLMVVWDSKRWLLSDHAKTAEINAQTMSKITTYDNLKRCSKLTMNTEITRYGVSDFVRVGDPEPLGWGDDNFIVCSWKRT